MKPFFKTNLGEIYNLDCNNFMDSLDDNSFDLVLTDPPYGIGEAKGKNKSRGARAKAKDYGTLDWDNAPPPNSTIQDILRVSKNSIMFGGNFFNLPPSPCWIVWDKNNGNNDFADCELAWTNFKTAVRKVKFTWNGMLQENMKLKEVRVHPTQKPVGVMKWILERYSKKTDIVFDPFLGSGTTALACEILGIRWVGIEREQQYCEMAKNRLLEPRQKTLF